MPSQPDTQSAPLTLARWAGMTTLGWFIGILLVVGLALLSDIVMPHGHGPGGQAAVGIGMGTGVGLMQWLVLRRRMDHSRGWMWGSLAGFSLAFIAVDQVESILNTQVSGDYLVPFAAVGGAVLSGLLQWHFVLRERGKQAWHWILHNTLAWMLAYLITAGLTLLNVKSQTPIPKVLIVIVALLFLSAGGPVLGLITGRFMVELLQSKKEKSAETGN